MAVNFNCFLIKKKNAIEAVISLQQQNYFYCTNKLLVNKSTLSLSRASYYIEHCFNPALKNEFRTYM